MRMRAPMAWQDVQTQVDKCLSTIYHQQSPQPTDISAALTSAKCQTCGSQTHQRNDRWYKDEICKTCGKRGHLAKVCRSVSAQTPRHGSPKSTGNGTRKGSDKRIGKRKGKKRTPGTCLCCGQEGHKKTECKFKTATCSNC